MGSKRSTCFSSFLVFSLKPWAATHFFGRGHTGGWTKFGTTLQNPWNDSIPPRKYQPAMVATMASLRGGDMDFASVHSPGRSVRRPRSASARRASGTSWPGRAGARRGRLWLRGTVFTPGGIIITFGRGAKETGTPKWNPEWKHGYQNHLRNWPLRSFNIWSHAHFGSKSGGCQSL